MAGERTYSILTYPDHDEAIAFYEALGFRRTYRQLRPNPHAVVQFEDIAFHLSAVDGFDPATSLGRAELLTRLSRDDEAAAALQAAQTGLTGEEAAALRDDLAHARQVIDSEQ